ncbi:hypothetical protein DM01DRAFT_1337934 [Hesseltinella vesiculosa]|uniref:N-acetyltransferase domain-containing protein n=1 Tax=Hesseltinella vesiculosa TaxID=101127 RepID=A0A1X2GB54_9FUNG|nr:hypothetical protein DM01DRAFT_1337934 [Hesseltinella vesiculosa]
MPPVTKRPYDLTALAWNDDHSRNDQDIYCYCGKGFNSHKSMAQCNQCRQWYHCGCMPCLEKRPLMFGDVFYDFVCSICSQGEEKFGHDTLSWSGAVQLVLYHLTRQKRLGTGKQQDRYYFRFTSEVCEWLENEWDRLLKDRHKSATWRNTVASCLSTHPKLFLSGAAESSYGKGWWALTSEDPLTRHDHVSRDSSAKDPDQKVKKKLKRRTAKPESDMDAADATPTKKAKMQPENELSTNETTATATAATATKPKSKAKGKEKATTPDQPPVAMDLDDKVSTPDVKPAKAPEQKKPKSKPDPLMMDAQDEWNALQILEHAPRELTPQEMRFRRKLKLRRMKRNLHLKLFDIDQVVGAHLRSKTPMEPMSTETPLLGDMAVPTSRNVTVDRDQLSHGTKYENSFVSRLCGAPRLASTLTAKEPWLSAWNGRKLRPFIRRDFENKTARMALLEQIKCATGQPSRAKAITNRMTMPGNDTSIDYVYFQPQHLDQANLLLSRCFWDGIDVSESLQFPEFSVLAMYKRCVVGCAFMTPMAYITYFAVLPGWEGAGIGQFMLYHLFQTMISKDVTLHVSANNNAMILYQKFGFKPEQFVVNFYDKYLPEQSGFSKNAFFLRLRR